MPSLESVICRDLQAPTDHCSFQVYTILRLKMFKEEVSNIWRGLQTPTDNCSFQVYTDLRLNMFKEEEVKYITILHFLKTVVTLNWS